jgi:hypothetical protein
VDLEQGLLGLRIGRQRPGALELPAMGVLVAFVEITDYVFALVLLTPLHPGILAKDVPYGLVEPFGPVDHAEKPLAKVELTRSLVYQDANSPGTMRLQHLVLTA